MAFMAEPLKTLETIEDVRAEISNPTTYDDPMAKYRVKSNWLVSIIDEIVASGDYPYNATIKRIAEERLGFQKQPDAYYSNEGNPLSTLIYNAQRFRSSDNLRTQGFQPFTPDLLQKAFESKKKIEVKFDGLIGGSMTDQYSVRQIGGKLYAMPPRSKKKYIQPQGQPAKLV